MLVGEADLVQEIHIVLVSSDPGRAYPAMMLAMGAATLGTKVRVYTTMSGLDMVRKDKAKEITMPGMPPLEKLFNDAKEMGVEFTACGPSKEFLAQMGIRPDALESGVEMETVEVFLSRALPAAKEGGIVLFI